MLVLLHVMVPKSPAENSHKIMHSSELALFLEQFDVENITALNCLFAVQKIV